MAASDDGVRKPSRLETDLVKKEKHLSYVLGEKGELAKSEDAFLTSLGSLNHEHKGFLAYLGNANPDMQTRLQELATNAETLHADYPAKFFDENNNLNVGEYTKYLDKLSGMAKKSASFDSLYKNDLEFHAKAYIQTLDADKRTNVVPALTGMTILSVQRGPRHELFMKDIIKNTIPGSVQYKNANQIMALTKASNAAFNAFLASADLPQRANNSVIQKMVQLRDQLAVMARDPKQKDRAIKFMNGIEELIRNDKDHKLTYGELASIITKRASIIIVKSPLDKIVEDVLSSPEMKSQRQSVTRGSISPNVETPKAQASPIVETPKAEAPKAEAPKAEAPKIETPTTTKSSVWVKGVAPNAVKPTTTERSSSNLANDKLKAMIVSLNGAGWTPSALPDKSNPTQPIAIIKDDKSFLITPDKLTTSSNNVETFKAMLQAFTAANPDKEPRITTNNAQALDKWQQAYKETFPGKEVPKNLVEVKIDKAPEAPKPAAPVQEERTSPSLK